MRLEWATLPSRTSSYARAMASAVSSPAFRGCPGGRPQQSPRIDEVLKQRAVSVARRRQVREPRVSVVIAALNEAENMPLLLPAIGDDVHEILVVDGDSVDGTTDVARALDARVRILRQFGKGKGAALRTGFAVASGDIIVTMDGDCSMDPGEIPAFVGLLRANADFVKGSRFLHGAGTTDMPFHRKLGNAAFVALVRVLFGGRFTDLCYGYNAFWADVLPRLDLYGDGFEIETVMNIRALRARLNVMEVPSCESKRIYGDAKLKTFSDGWRVLKAILRERFAAPPPAHIPAEGPLATGIGGVPEGLPLAGEISGPSE
jgi:glycosyltransferase involved in cell wall biosynthesis